MGLLGVGTTIVAAVVAVGFVVATLALWRPVEARGVLRWPIRVALILGCQLSALLVVGLVINNSYAFYASWRELLGRHSTVRESFAQPGQLDGQLREQLRINAALGRGTVVPLAVKGTRSGVRLPGTLLYLPPQYGDPSYAGRSFPVVELFAGFPGTPRTWITALKLPTILDSEIRSGHAVPFIAVMPLAWYLPHDSECVDAVDGPQLDTYLSFDVRTAVERAVRASTEDSQWTAMGFSTGGYCAANLAFRHPTMFHAAVSIAGYNHAVHDRTTGNLFRSMLGPWELNNDLWRATHLPGPAINLLLVSTRADKVSYIENNMLARAAAAPTRIWQLTLPAGGHNAATFRAELPTCLAWLSRFVSSPLAPIPAVDGYLPRQSPTSATPVTPAQASEGPRPAHRLIRDGKR